MSSVICGTNFNYKIDTEHGINRNGFIAEGTESIVFKGVKYGGDLRYSCALKFKPKTRLHDFMNREYKILELISPCLMVTVRSMQQTSFVLLKNILTVNHCRITASISGSPTTPPTKDGKEIQPNIHIEKS